MDKHSVRAAFGTARGAAKRLKAEGVEQIRQKATEFGIDVEEVERSASVRRAELADRAGGVAGQFSETQAGQKIGDVTSTVGRHLANAPVLTAVPDAIQARYDLREQVDRLKQDPTSLRELIWTATAVREVEAALLRYRKVRAARAGAHLAIGDVSAVMFQLSARLAGRMATGDTIPPADRVLRSAFRLAITQLQKNPVDAGAHYALARVYMLTGDTVAAAVSARAAVRTTVNSTLRGDALTTLAFAKLTEGDYAGARRASDMAIAAEASTGHLIAAELAESGSGDAREMASAAAAHRRLVTSDDMSRYFGRRPSGKSVFKTVVDIQVEKTKSLTATAKQVVDRQLNPPLPKDPGADNV